MKLAKLLDALHLQIAKCIEAIRECVRYCDEAGVCGRGKLWGRVRLLRHADGSTPIPALMFDADGELRLKSAFCFPPPPLLLAPLSLDCRG